jgi:predicted nuclease of predicted toxin-antitoxin system
MRFLINMNLPRELGKRLGELGHQWRHVGDIGMAEASDDEVIAKAREAGEVILTHDLDYGNLLAFSGEPSPSVITFRLRDVSVSSLIDQITSSWPRLEEPLVQGSVVIFSDVAIRIRRLPIERSPQAMDTE